MENIIIKAIEGGYNPSDETNWKIDKDVFGFCTLVYFSEEYPDEGSDEYDQNKIVLDPRFFQALGKACGWEEVYVFMEDVIENHPFLGGNLNYPYHEGAGMTYNSKPEVYHALRFHEISLTKGWKKAVEYLQELTNLK